MNDKEEIAVTIGIPLIIHKRIIEAMQGYKIIYKDFYSNLILNFNNNYDNLKLKDKVDYTKEKFKVYTIKISINKNQYDIFKSKCKKINITQFNLIGYLTQDFIQNTDISKIYKKKIKKEIKFKRNSDIINFEIPAEILKYTLKYEMKELVNDLLDNNFKKDSKTSLREMFKTEEDFYLLFQNIYKMLFIFKYTTGEITECIKNRDPRTVQKWFKKLGWELNGFEAQQRVVDRGRRDYKEIRNKSRQTMLKSANITKPEEYTRQKLNTYLPNILHNKEVIIGLNNISILDNGKEIDIPIIIINNNKIYKYAVEYNGYYWHQNKGREYIKKEVINKKGYCLFTICPKKNATSKQIIEYIDEQILKIGEYIQYMIDN